ncbi:hypothetical protein BCR34DRAFT_584646 [Clohesyomyces aquaticus]|uniref:Rhodopsin domain-containing protein n=1 Tax=Clohesyomyces aquaticus TaxID=1231657 RepID=A0A1Y2A075_9PLEO|nr:hypothetical protein BCR34DRAFT_584646 [Clohesyomyces aquaticus]
MAKGNIKRICQPIRSLWWPRIFKAVQWARYAFVCLSSACAIHGAVAVWELSLICRPLGKQWDPNAEGSCGNQIVSYVVLESCGIFLDLLILSLPIPLTLRLNLSLVNKLWVIFVLDIGVVAFDIAGLRPKSLALIESPDFVYAQTYLSLLSAIGGVMLNVMLCVTPVVALALRRDGRRKVVRGPPTRYLANTFGPDRWRGTFAGLELVQYTARTFFSSPVSAPGFTEV